MAHIIPATEAYRIVSRAKGTDTEWTQTRAALGYHGSGRARIYPKLSTARSVLTQLAGGSYGEHLEYKIQRAVGWEDVE